MEKQSYVSPGQVIVVLAVTRILFSTVHFISLHAGRSIQDILPALPAAFLLNLLTALPLLALLKRHRGKDLVECATNIFGRGAGIVTATFYFLLFGWSNIVTQMTTRYYINDTVLEEAKVYAILLPLLAITVYIAAKGFESIVRFGTIVFAFYAGIMVLLVCTLIPSIRPSIGPRFLLPLFFNGPGIFVNELIAQFNGNVGIIYLAFCASFFKSSIKLGKVFAKWNLLMLVLMVVLYVLCIAVLGPFGARQFFPLEYLAAQSTVSVFYRLDPLYSMSWMLNMVLTVSLFLYFQIQCLEKIGLRKHRKVIVILVGILDSAATFFLQNYDNIATQYALNWFFTGANLMGMIVLPLILLIGDRIVRGKGTAHEMA